MDVLASLSSSALGLTSVEARQRLGKYGLNQLEGVRITPAWQRLGKEFFSIFSLILWAAAILALGADWIDRTQGMSRTAYALVIVILLSGIFSFWQKNRVEKTLAALRKLLPQKVNVLRDAVICEIDATQLVPGDIIVLEQGDNIPADCQLLEAIDVRVDNSAITGESIRKSRNVNASDTEALIFASNVLLAGTALVSGRAKAVVFATGMQTEVGKIAHLTQTTAHTLSPLQHEIAHLSRAIAIVAIVMGFSFFCVGRFFGVPFWRDFIFSIGIIVALVPEGLLPTLTLALVLATQRLAKHNVLIRYLPAVEVLGSTSVICTDKTGTLTQNRMQVRQIFLEKITDIDVNFERKNNPGNHYKAFFLTARLCHDLQEMQTNGTRSMAGDPMEVALCAMAEKQIPEEQFPEKQSYVRLHEISFDAERKRLSVIYQTPEGPVLYAKGAPETVLPLCTQIIDGDEIHAIDSEQSNKIVHAQESMADRGLRVLALAYRPLAQNFDVNTLEEKWIFAGLAGLEDPPRPEVPDAIRRCREAGIKVIMVTGDHPQTATAIARKIGLVRSDHPLVITGEQLRHFSAAHIQLALDAEEIIFARAAADQKMLIVNALKTKQHIVAATGDGVNDAPALKAAHIGIAMGISGTDVAKEAADMVLLDDNFASIVRAIEEGRAVFDNIRKFLTYILVHNVAELIPYLVFVLFRLPLALTPIQALMIDMGTDSLTALGLGVEKPDPSIMQRPPRPIDERLMNRALVLRAYCFLGVIEAAIAMIVFFFVLRGFNWTPSQNLAATDPVYLQATTACLSTIVAMQIVNVFLCRSTSRSIFATPLWSNRLILWGVLLEILLLALVTYTPWGNYLVGTMPLHPNIWFFIIPLGVIMLILEELRKWVVRARTKLQNI